MLYFTFSETLFGSLIFNICFWRPSFLWNPNFIYGVFFSTCIYWDPFLLLMEISFIFIFIFCFRVPYFLLTGFFARGGGFYLWALHVNLSTEFYQLFTCILKKSLFHRAFYLFFLVNLLTLYWLPLFLIFSTLWETHFFFFLFKVPFSISSYCLFHYCWRDHSFSGLFSWHAQLFGILWAFHVNF